MDNAGHLQNIIACPHCHEPIEIVALNCGIFRHGYLTSTRQQLNSHATKEIIATYRETGVLIGCGEPFRVNEDHSVEMCDYV